MAAMAASTMDPFLQGTSGRNTRGLLRIIILVLIAAASVSSRLFSVISREIPGPDNGTLLGAMCNELVYG